MATDKSLNILTNKEAFQKFSSAFKIVRALFMSNLQYSPEAGLIFETLLISLSLSSTDSQSQTEVMRIELLILTSLKLSIFQFYFPI